MSSPKPQVGTIGWIDLTVENAEELRRFYSEVVGWSSDAVDMGEYSDFNMTPPGGDPVAGVCHARGTNAELPAAWMIYIVVEALDESLERCRALGGEIVRPAGEPGPFGRFAVIRDPGGAVCALFEPAADAP